MRGCWCNRSIAKNFLVTLNGLFVIAGGAALGFGIYVFQNRDDIGGILSLVPLTEKLGESSDNERQLLHIGAIVLMAAGGFIFLVGIWGCCGALVKSSGVLVLYTIVIAVLLVCQIVLVIILFLFESQIYCLYPGLRIEASQLGLSRTAIELGWDTAQATLQCCGVNNSADWNFATRWSRTYRGTWQGETISVSLATVPISCCETLNPGVFPDSLQTLNFTDLNSCLTTGTASTNTQGCYEPLREKLKEYSDIVIAVAIVLAFVETVQLIAALYLCQRIRTDWDEEVHDDDADDEIPVYKQRARLRENSASTRANSFGTTTTTFFQRSTQGTNSTLLRPSIQTTKTPVVFAPGAIYGNGAQYHNNQTVFHPGTYQFGGYPNVNLSSSVFSPQEQTRQMGITTSRIT